MLAVPLAVTCVAAFGDEAFDCDPSESFDAELDRVCQFWLAR